MGLEIADIIPLQLQRHEIMPAIELAKNRFFLDNLRYRHQNVSFDSKLRGFVGELAVKKWMEERGISLVTNNYIEEDGNMDIDFLYRKGEKTLDIELKTSLIPDVDENFENVLLNRDIKLICRNHGGVENLKGDVHIQVYFRQKRKRKDEWLSQQKINLESNDFEYLYDSFCASRYENDTYLFAWIDKPSLIEIINSKPDDERKWSYKMRQFWRCSLKKDSKKPIELIYYLNNI